MKVYLVNGWDDYYPTPNNTLAVFTSKTAAERWLLNYLENSSGEHTYDRPDRCGIFTMEVQDDLSSDSL